MDGQMKVFTISPSLFFLRSGDKNILNRQALFCSAMLIKQSFSLSISCF